MVADRFFAAEKVLGVMHLLGAGLLFLASRVSTPAEFFWVLLAYAFCYSPTLALVNAISFNQMASPEKQFPAIRVFGTIGWIVAGLVRGLHGRGSDRAAAAHRGRGLAGAGRLLARPAPHAAEVARPQVTVRDILGLDALTLMKDRSFAIFVLGSLLICIPLAFYYGFTNLFLNEKEIVNAAGKQTLGQISEVAFMLVMPLFFRRLGVKWMLVAGMGAWAARYVLFAYGNPGDSSFMYYLGILLHGICYDFFFVTGQIYVDNSAPKAIQASAQGFITLVTYGVGMLIGTGISGLVVKGYQVAADNPAAGHDWTSIWLWPAGMAVVVILLFVVLFDGKGMGNEGGRRRRRRGREVERPWPRSTGSSSPRTSWACCS